MMDLTKEQEKKLEEVKMFTVAGLSLHRAISVDDVKWAIEEGFKKGILAEVHKAQT